MKFKDKFLSITTIILIATAVFAGFKTDTLIVTDDARRESTSELRHNSLMPKSEVLDIVDMFAGEFLYSGSNVNTVIPPFMFGSTNLAPILALSETPLEYFEGGFPITAGTNYMMYGSEKTYKFLPQGLYRGQFYTQLLDTNLVANAGPLYATFRVAAIVATATNYIPVFLGESDVATVNDTLERIDLKGTIESDVSVPVVASQMLEQYGFTVPFEEFYFGGLFIIISPINGFMNFKSGQTSETPPLTNYPAKMTIPIPTGDLPTKEWVKDYTAQKTVYASTDFMGTNVTDLEFELAPTIDGTPAPNFYWSMATIWNACTNETTSTQNDVTLWIYTKGTRLSSDAQYRGTMSFGFRTLDAEAATGTNTLKVTHLDLWEAGDLVVMDSVGFDDKRAFYRIDSIPDAETLVLEDNLATNYLAGSYIAKGNQFGQFIYYNLDGTDKVYGKLNFTNEQSLTRFNMSLVGVK